MRKILVALMVLMLLAANSVAAVGEVTGPIEQGTGETAPPADPVQSIEISNFSADLNIVYDWDVDAVLDEETQGEVTEHQVTFQAVAQRYLESNDLSIDIEAALPEGVTLETVSVKLGYASDDGFAVIEAVESVDFVQLTSEEGTACLSVSTDFVLADLVQSELIIKVLAQGTDAEGVPVSLAAENVFSLPEEPNVINKDAVMETNLLEAIGDTGVTDVTEDDWVITEAALDIDGVFFKEVQILFGEAEEVSDIVVGVCIIGDENLILCDTEATAITSAPPVVEEELELEMLSSVWLGDTYVVPGFWIQPLDEFYLSRKSVPIRFLLQEPPSNLNVSIFEAEFDESGNLALGDMVSVIYQDEFRTGLKGRSKSISRGDLPENYYTIKLKGKNMPYLDGGKTYALVLMTGDTVIAFNEATPAILTFMTADDGTLTKGNTKVKIQRCGMDQQPKYNRNDRQN